MPSDLDQTATKAWPRLRAAHEAVMLDDARRVLAESRRQVEAHARSHGLDGQAGLDDMIVGDVTINQQTPPARTGPGTLAKLALAGALAAGSGGIGLAAGALLPELLGLFGDPPPAAERVEVDRDWRLGEPIVE